MSAPAPKRPRPGAGVQELVAEASSARGYGANDGALARSGAQYVVDASGALKTDGEGMRLSVSEGTFNPTAASRLSALAVSAHAQRWRGVGVDWGCGGGLLGLLCARQENVSRLIGMDYDIPNVALSARNAAANGLACKTAWYGADSFDPFDDAGRAELAQLRCGLGFVVGNPPASGDDDGFSYRRRIFLEAAPLLEDGAVVCVQALSHYGLPRVKAAAEVASKRWAELQAGSTSPAPTAGCRYRFLGVAASTPWMELGMGAGSYDMREQIEMYAREEERGGAAVRYFCGPDRRVRDVRIALEVELDEADAAGFFDAEAADDQESLLTAKQVLEMWDSGHRPLGRWQMYMFEWVKSSD